MLCRGCRRLVGRDQLYCGTCGRPVARGILPPLDLVLRGGTRVALVGRVTIGRAPDNGVQLDDPSVSRHHCVITVSEAGTEVGDAGSTHGTFVDGARVGRPQPLRDGARLRLGDVELVVERRRDHAAAGRTLVVGAGRSLAVPAVGPARDTARGPATPPVRLRPGCALKRLAEGESDRRYVLRDLGGSRFLRLDEADARLIPLLDGSHSPAELAAQADRELGPSGALRLARLIVELAERGLLEGAGGGVAGAAPAGVLARLLRPRSATTRRAGGLFDAVYRRGGFLLYTAAGRIAIALVAVVGIAAFADLLATGRATPFVVGGQVGAGALVFIAGRLLVAGLHECAHGLTMAACGRRVRTAGLKVLLIMPYVFVDTSEAWLEPRRRRMAISLAGPVSDLALGGAFALVSRFTAGTWQQVWFQLSFGAYLGALFNLNPLLDRDGYHVLVDLLSEPGLRGRARARLSARLAARPVAAGEPRALEVYAVCSLVWLLVSALFATLMVSRYYPRLVDVTHHRELVLIGLGIVVALLFLPLVLTIGVPLAHRLRRQPT